MWRWSGEQVRRGHESRSGAGREKSRGKMHLQACRELSLPGAEEGERKEAQAESSTPVCPLQERREEQEE